MTAITPEQVLAAVSRIVSQKSNEQRVKSDEWKKARGQRRLWVE